MNAWLSRLYTYGGSRSPLTECCEVQHDKGTASLVVLVADLEMPEGSYLHVPADVHERRDS